MMDPRDDRLEQLYAEVPSSNCLGYCASKCERPDPGPRERERMAAAGVELPPFKEMILREDRTCPALEDNHCRVYDARPMLCRLWGSTPLMACEYGCRPTEWVATDRAVEILDESSTI